MPDARVEMLERFEHLRVAVIGDAILDRFLYGRAEGLAGEAPVPRVRVEGRRDAPGGAANTAANLAALGARPTLLAVTGPDVEAAALGEVLARAGVPTGGLLPVEGRQTVTKQRVLAGERILLRIDSGSAFSLPPGAERALGARLRAVWREVDAIILSDYGYGLFTDALLGELAGLQRDDPRVVVVDARKVGRFRRVAPTAVKPNYREAVELLGLPACHGPGTRVAQMFAHGAELLERSGARVACVTLDVEGAVVFERGRTPHRTFTEPRPEQNANGAGDTFVGVLALALAAGADPPAAAELASLAARVVVEEEGTTCCTLEDLRLQLVRGGGKVVGAPKLLAGVERLRRRGRRVVLTSGRFDLLHRGHVTFLGRAKALGDVLVVAVQADGGGARTFNGFEDRAQVLAGLSCVDHVVGYEGDTCEALIRALRPEVYARGGGHTRESLAEAAWVEALGGEVRLLPHLAAFSTGGLVERTRAGNGGGERA